MGDLAYVFMNEFVNQVKAAQEHLVHAWNDAEIPKDDPDAWPPKPHSELGLGPGDWEYHLSVAIGILQEALQPYLDD